MNILEKIRYEKSKLDFMIEQSNGDLLNDIIQKQSKKVDKLLIKYYKIIMKKVECVVND